MNISDFRKDLSKHFNEAVQGRPVFITRAGQMFKLEAYIPPEGETMTTIEITPNSDVHASEDGVGLKLPPVAKKPKAPTYYKVKTTDQVGKTLPTELKPRFCNNGHPIPYPKDRCLGKKCKYA